MLAWGAWEAVCLSSRLTAVPVFGEDVLKRVFCSCSRAEQQQRGGVATASCRVPGWMKPAASHTAAAMQLCITDAAHAEHSS